MEGVFAVTKKERRRTRAGAAYLALELADASGRVEARVWNDVDLLDQRFGEGDAVHVLGRVERFGGKLQVQVRAVEAAEDADPSSLTPSLRRDADELDGFYEFLAAEIAHPGLAAARRLVRRRLGSARSAPRGFPRPERTVTTATPAACSSTPSGSTTLCRETAQLHPRLRARPAARRGASARRRPDPRARARAVLPADGGGPPARPRPPRPARGRGARPRSRSRGALRAAARDRLSPRPAGGEDRRSGRPLPRQPARRASRDAPRRRRLMLCARPESAGADPARAKNAKGGRVAAAAPLTPD